ncbi:MAG: UvrB/UvrC motif-containing protein [Bacillota bacterium]|nr:UvrB/UvrC motif-containing protein [Bacillota bacterium]
MLCDRCRKNEASVHIVKIINGARQESNLCEACARQSNEIEISDTMKFGSPFTFQNILSGLVDYLNVSPQGTKPVEAACPKCGTTYGEFKQTGFLGCDGCYKYFNTALEAVVRRVQGNSEHIGKVPLKSAKELVEKKRLIKLKEELQKAILMEEYEKAAELRDEIRDIQKSEGEV